MKTRPTPSAATAWEPFPVIIFGEGRRFSKAKKGNWNPTWTTPATSTPIPRVSALLVANGTAQMTAPIKHRFKKTGVTAGTANRPRALRMPPAMATSEIKKRYGKVNRKAATVATYFSDCSTKPGAIIVTSHGAPRTPSSVKSRRISASRPNIRSKKALTWGAGYRDSYSA